MSYQILVLDLDGTLTNSKKEITPPTRQALLEIQEAGKKVVLASGRPTMGVAPLAKQLNLADYGSYILSFNGGRITNCRTGEIVYNLAQDDMVALRVVMRLGWEIPNPVNALDETETRFPFASLKPSAL